MRFFVNARREDRSGAFRLWLLASLVMAVNVGCAAGPDYAPPDYTPPAAWNVQPQGGLHEGKVADGELAEWWDVFNDPVLSDLVRRSVKANLDLRQAKSRVRQARASRKIAQSDLYPSVDGSASFTKSRGSRETGGGAEVDLFSTGLDAAWELDIFGGTRRSVEAATADLQAREEDLRDVLVSLAAEVGLSYLDVRTFQARLTAAEQNLETQEETYRLTEYRRQAGLATDLDVQQSRYNLESTRSQIPTLQTSIEESRNRLAIFLGQAPGAVHGLLHERRPIPGAPCETAVGVPADLLRRRPDVRRAERELAAQTARVGAATAELYPKLTLKGSLGLDALTFSNLFLAGSRSFNFGPTLTIPVFNGGAIRNNIEAQSALQEQALIAYESTVLKALEEVENALAAYAQEENRRRALVEASSAARQAASLSWDRYMAGQIDFGDVLDAQRSLLSFEDQLAQSDGTVSSNLIRLFKTLGGGWTPEAGSEVAKNDSVNPA